MKKDDIRCTAITKAAIIGIIESKPFSSPEQFFKGSYFSPSSYREKMCWGRGWGKLDHPVHNSKENLSGYDTLRCNSNGVTCYTKKDLCFTTKTLH